MHKSPKKHPKLKIFFLALFLLLVLCGVGSYIWYLDALRPICRNEDDAREICELQDFVIADGTRSTEVADQLQEQGIIKSSLAFQIYLRFGAKDATIKHGAYRLSARQDAATIVEQFNAGTSATMNVRFLPGDTIMNNKKILTQLGFTEAEIDTAFSASYDYKSLGDSCTVDIFEGRPEGATLEGYISGDTYNVFATSTVEEILLKPLAKTCEIIVKNDLKNRFAAQGLSLYEGITLASVVQRESGSLVDDMPAVAKVFLNRLNNGIALGSDAIIAYRADQINPDRNKQDMSYLTAIGCPWNSRQCTGLPPSPISSPAETALNAVASPAEHNYFYFLTGDDNKMYYATTEDEHNQNAANYCQVLCGYL